MIKGGNDCFLQTQFGPKASETISQRRFLPKNKMIPISILKSVRHPYRQQIHLRKIQNWKIMLIIRSLPMQKLAVHPTLNLHLKFFPRPPTALVCPTPPPSCSAVTIVVNFFTHRAAAIVVVVVAGSEFAIVVVVVARRAVTIVVDVIACCAFAIVVVIVVARRAVTIVVDVVVRHAVTIIINFVAR
jgi:hypothetical protein